MEWWIITVIVTETQQSMSTFGLAHVSLVTKIRC